MREAQHQMTEPTTTPPPAPPSAPPPSPPPAPPSTSVPSRPTGITVLAVLSAIGGILGILGGVALIGLGGLGAATTGEAAFFGLGAVFGILALATGIASLAFAYGAWTLQPWAWMLGVVLQGASIVLAVIAIISGSDISSQIIGVAIAGIILYYLMQPNIKAAFGRA
jgi:hypothetical protein